jgi:hypothetical protein
MNKILVSLKGFSDSERKALSQMTALWLASGSLPATILSILINVSSRIEIKLLVEFARREITMHRVVNIHKGPSTRTFSHPILCPICTQIECQSDSLSDFQSRHHINPNLQNCRLIIFFGEVLNFENLATTVRVLGRMESDTESDGKLC